MHTFSTTEGLEVLGSGGIGWCDIDVPAARIIELNGGLYLRLHLKGLLFADDEYLPCHLVLSNKRLRVASRVILKSNAQLLLKGTRVCGLANMGDSCGWHDAVIKDIQETVHGETLVEVDWRLSEDCNGVPINNLISVSREEVCAISLGDPSLHPALIQWRNMMKNILEARPDYTRIHTSKEGFKDPADGDLFKLDLWFVDDAVSGEMKSQGLLHSCEKLHNGSDYDHTNKDENTKIELQDQLETAQGMMEWGDSASNKEGSTDSDEACTNKEGIGNSLDLCSFGSKISVEDPLDATGDTKDAIDSNMVRRRCPILDLSCLESIRTIRDLDFFFHDDGKIDVYLP